MASRDDMDWLYSTPEPNEQPKRPAAEQRPTARPWESDPAPQRPTPSRPSERQRPASDPRPPRPAPAPDTAGARAVGAPPGESRRATPAAPPRRRPRHNYWPRRIFTLLVLTLVLWAAFLVFTPWDALNSVKRIDTTPEGARPADQVGTAVLIAGTDSRENLSAADAERLGVGGDADSGRTDTMMLLYTPPSGRSVLISLPRDSYVSIPGHGDSKLNAAFAWGGPKLLVETVEANTGLKIDGYAEVGFAGFALLVDAVDGVDICVDDTLPAESVYPEIKAGCQTLDAPKALWYVRSRHSSAMQDLDRIQRQRKFMSALLKKLATPETVVNPFRYWDVTHTLAKAVRLGNETSLDSTLTMGNGMRDIASGRGFAMSMPISDPDYHTNAGSSVLWDEEATKKLCDQLKRGDTSNLEQYMR